MSTVDTEALTETLSATVRAAVNADARLQALAAALGVDLVAFTDEIVTLVEVKVPELVEVKTPYIEGADEDDPTVDERYGPAPTAEELREIHARQAARIQETIERIVARSLTRLQAAGRLGVSPQSISDRRKARSLFAIKRGREFYFPSWQFHDDGTLPGLDRVIEAWPGSQLELAGWAERPSPDLGGRTPAQALAARDVDDVVALEQAIAAAAW